MLLSLLLLLLLAVPAAWGASYHVVPGTTNVNSCAAATNPTTPITGVTAGIACLQAGDTLVMHAGTYTGVTVSSVPSGGGEGSRVTIRGAPGEAVTWVSGKISLTSGEAYITFSDFTIDCAGTECHIATADPTHHIRYSTMEIKDSTTASGARALIFGTASFTEYLHLRVHGAGYGNCPAYSAQGCHGVLLSGANTLIDGCTVYDNGGHGILLDNGGTMTVTDTTIRNSTVYNNGLTDPRGLGGSGLFLSNGARNVAYNTVAYGNAESGIRLNDGCDSCALYHNTVVGNTLSGIEIDHSADVIVRNNISYHNGDSSVGQQLIDWQGTVTQDHNLLTATVGTTALDTGACACPGTLVAAPTPIVGNRGTGALAFNGTTQYVSSALPTIPAGQPVTILLSVKAPGGASNGTFNVGGGPDRLGAHIPWNDNSLYFDDGAARLSIDFALYLGTWTRVALLSNGVNYQAVYVNGVLVKEQTVAQGTHGVRTGFEVGRYAVSGAATAYHLGALDDVQLWKGLLTAAQIQADAAGTPLP